MFMSSEPTCTCCMYRICVIPIGYMSRINTQTGAAWVLPNLYYSPAFCNIRLRLEIFLERVERMWIRCFWIITTIPNHEESSFDFI